MITKLSAIKSLINESEIPNWNKRECNKLLSEIHRDAGILDFLASPFIQNIISLLAPFVSDYRVKSAIQLLQEWASGKGK